MMFSVRFMLLVVVSFFVMFPAFSENTIQPLSEVQQKLAALEKRSGGHIGLAAINTGNYAEVNYHANERFPFDCTAKTIVVAAILKKSETDPTLLQERLYYKKSDLVEWSPITEKYVKEGMTVSQLCAAAMTVSDNAAVNVLLKTINGPSGVNAYARSIGDNTFYLKDWWPNEAKWIWGDNTDTTTPIAMEKTLQNLLLGNALALKQRALLTQWMKENKTGDARIRAGVPSGWVVADKTGTNFYHGAIGDIAVIWPPKASPLVIAIYYKNKHKNAVKREDVIAAATRIVLQHFLLKHE